MRILKRIRLVIIGVSVFAASAGIIPAERTACAGHVFGQDARSVSSGDGVSSSDPESAVDAIEVKRDAIVKSALSFVGTPYRFGGADPRRGFDCCGFVMYVYKLNKISLPRTSGSQFLNGKYIEKKDAKRGDLLFWHIPSGRISHVGIYIGEGKFVHSPVPGKRVRIEYLDELYWRKYYFGAATYLE